MALIRSFAYTRTGSPDIYQNLDNGVNWLLNTSIPDIPDNNGLAISRTNANHFVICGSNAGGTEDLIYFSLDNGTTITQSVISTNLACMSNDTKPDVYIDGTRVFVSSLAGLYYSGNSGANFSVLVEYDDPAFDGGTLIPIGERDSTKVYVNDNYVLVAISTEPGSAVKPGLYLSDDSGLTWTTLDNTLFPVPNAGFASTVNGLYCSADGDKITVAVSTSGTTRVIHSNNGWSSTSVALSSTSTSAISYTKSVFSVVDDDTIYYVLPFAVDGNTVSKSTDSGASWTTQSTGLITDTVNSISFYSPTEGFLLVYELGITASRVYKSTDSGVTFVPITADDEFASILSFIIAASIECGCPPGYEFDAITNNCVAYIEAAATNVGGTPSVLAFDTSPQYGNQGLTLFPSFALTDIPISLFPVNYPNPNGATISTTNIPYFYKNADYTASKLITPLVSATGAAAGATNSVTGDVWKRARNKVWGGIANPYTDTSGATCSIGNTTARLILNNISAAIWDYVIYDPSNNVWKNGITPSIVYTGLDDPTFPWLTFTKCITITQEKEYLIGIAGDNLVALDIDFDSDGSYTSVFELYNTTQSASYTFRMWYVIPITLPAGTHTIRLKGANLGGDFAFGAEIYDVPLQDFINNFVVDVFTADSYTAANLNAPVQTINCSAAGAAGYAAMNAALQDVTIFSTADYRGATVYDGGVWTCPTGYELDLCNGLPRCLLTEVVDKIDCSYKLEKCGDPLTIEYTDADTNPDIEDYVGKVLSDDTGCWQVSEATTLEQPTEKDTTMPPMEDCFECVKIYKIYDCKDLTTALYCTDQDLSEYVDIYSVTLLVNGLAVPGCYVIRNEQVLTCDPLLASNVQVVETFFSCSECLPKVYKLTNCANPLIALYSNTQSLSEQIGKSITIVGYPNICWEVSLELADVFNTIEVELAESYKDCECCLQYQCIK